MNDRDPVSADPDRIAALRRALRHAGPLGDEQIAIPGTGQVVRVSRPIDTDLLLEAAAGDPEQHLPYWAEVWPSGIALGSAIAAAPALVRHRPVIELGCGLGVTAAVALVAGADLLATDYSGDALALTALTCLRTTGREPETARINWRDPHDPVLGGDRRFHVVLAADVLYEQRDLDPLIGLIERLLVPGGLLWLAEPQRRPAAVFLERIANLGWATLTDLYRGPWPDPKDDGVVVRVHRIHPQSMR